MSLYDSDKPIVDAPSEITALVDHWIDGGEHWREGLILEQFLHPYRGQRLLAGDWVVTLHKLTDTKDVIWTAPRSVPTRSMRPEAAGAVTTIGVIS
jgi:hypothetical protein